MKKKSTKLSCKTNDQLCKEYLQEKNCIAKWDFNTALGDTIRHKYESMYVKVVEVSDGRGNIIPLEKLGL